MPQSNGVMTPNPITAFILGCSTCDAKAVARLLQAGFAPDTRDNYGLTFSYGRVEVANVLLAHGADIEGKDVRGVTALFHAVTYKRCKFVEHVAAAKANVSPADAHGWTRSTSRLPATT